METDPKLINCSLQKFELVFECKYKVATRAGDMILQVF